MWIARWARPSPAALDAVAHLKPIVVVTGGSRGIGLALARRFAKAGRDVAIIARGAGPLAEAAVAIERDFKARAFAIPLDITEESAPQRIEERLSQYGCYTDILVNCAGTGLAGPFVSHGEAEVARLLDLNVMALTRLMRHALPGMLARGHGGVVNVASLGGFTPGPHQAVYYASKAYVLSLTEAVASEIGGQGVRLMAIAPGPVDTEFHERMGAEHSFYRQLILALTPEQVANAGYRGYILGRRVIVPGPVNKVLGIALRILPHTLVLPLIGWLLQRREESPQGSRNVR